MATFSKAHHFGYLSCYISRLYGVRKENLSPLYYRLFESWDEKCKYLKPMTQFQIPISTITMNIIQILDLRSLQLQNQNKTQRPTLGTKNKNTQKTQPKNTHTTHHTHKATLPPRAFSGVSTYRWWCLVSFGMISANRVGKGHGAGPLWGNDEPWHWGE